MDLFLYGNGIRHQKVNRSTITYKKFKKKKYEKIALTGYTVSNCNTNERTLRILEN